MTKIKIIGDPGQHNVKAMEVWLKKYLEKFNLSLEEIYLAFIGSEKQLGEVCQKFWKGAEGLSSKEFSALIELHFTRISTVAYLGGVSPVILIKEGKVIPEWHFLDEIAHLKEDKIGWLKIKREAIKQLGSDYRFLLISVEEQELFSLFEKHLMDFFSDEIKCQYGLFSQMLKSRQEDLNACIKEPCSKHLELLNMVSLNSLKFYDTMNVAFFTTLPPSYPKKEDEEKLERVVIEYIRQMQTEPLYRKIKSVVAKLESPPKVANIYKCGAEIIELAQEFLEK